MNKQLNQYYIRIASISILIFLLLFNVQCKTKRPTECDYVSTVKALLERVKHDEPAKIKQMMAVNDKEFWQDGSTWTIIKNGAQKILDTIADVNRLKYRIRYNKESKIDYAVVTVILHEGNPISNIIQVRFLSPDSPFSCKVQSFDYYKVGASDKIDSNPVFDSSSIIR